MKIVLRIGAQILLAGLLFYGIVGATPELKLLFVILMLINVVAISCSTLITSSLGYHKLLVSASLNIAIALLFFLAGLYLTELLTYEVIEEISKDGSDPSARVVKARLVSFGGIQFLLIYLVHALLSYLDFVELRLPGTTAESPEFSPGLFSVRVGKKLHLIPFSEVSFIEASGNYIDIHCNAKKYSARLTLQEFSDKAHAENLVRIHRSFIVNISELSELEGTNDGYLAVLKTGQKIKVGKQYKPALFQRLGISV